MNNPYTDKRYEYRGNDNTDKVRKAGSLKAEVARLEREVMILTNRNKKLTIQNNAWQREYQRQYEIIVSLKQGSASAA